MLGVLASLRHAPSLMMRCSDECARSMLSRAGTYGAPRVHAELRAEGQAVGRKRIARLMRAAEIVGVSHRRAVITTRRDRDARPAPDLVDRNFTADRPNQLWVADITYIPTAAGFLYLAVVLAAFSRRSVGWAMETHLRTELLLAGLEMAIGQRKPSNVIHHSDQGSQYTSLAFGGRCREAGVLPSMGSVGDTYDNAMCESFFATLECELLARRRFTSQAEARMAVFSYIEGGTIPLVATPASAISPQLPMRRRCSGKPKRPKSPGVHRTGSTPISGPPPPDSWRSLRQATYPQLLHHLKGHDPLGAGHIARSSKVGQATALQTGRRASARPGVAARDQVRRISHARPPRPR